MQRAVILVMDSLGIGATADAARFGDDGADTLGSIARYCARQRGRPLTLPNLSALGLMHAARGSTGAFPESVATDALIVGT